MDVADARPEDRRALKLARELDSARTRHVLPKHAESLAKSLALMLRRPLLGTEEDGRMIAAQARAEMVLGQVAPLEKAVAASPRMDMANRMRDMAAMMAKDPMPMSEAEMAAKMRSMADEMAPE